MANSYIESEVFRWHLLIQRALVAVIVVFAAIIPAQKIPLPRFQDLRAHYPGYFHYGGEYRNHELEETIGINDNSNLLLHDTSALRLSYSLNNIGGNHSLGTELIRLSKFGHDSIEGKNKMQYIFLPISFGPYLADKYGYPNISKLHQLDPVQTKHAFWGKQGILRVITYTVHGNQPKGHVALWDCYHFYQSKDWIAENNLVTVEFWESPDSNCSEADLVETSSEKKINNLSSHRTSTVDAYRGKINNMDNEKLVPNNLKHLIVPTNARHSSRKLQKMKSKHSSTPE
ncbi:hypothetical protein ACF0H5_008636 [Mactra antiquata]